jgi:hypothetical protein
MPIKIVPFSVDSLLLATNHPPQAKKLRKQQLEEEARLRAVQRKLEELEVEGQKELQDIENRRRRAAAEADTKAATVEAGARLNSQQILQVGGACGLEAVRVCKHALAGCVLCGQQFDKSSGHSWSQAVC